MPVSPALAAEIAKHPTRCQDLADWSHETGQPIPKPADVVAYMEAHGWIVDLATGDSTRDPDWHDHAAPAAPPILDAQVVAWHRQGLQPVPNENFGNLERFPWIRLVPITEPVAP